MRKISIYLVTVCQENININKKMGFFFLFEGARMTTDKLVFLAFSFFSPPRTENQCIVSHFIFSKAYIILIEKKASDCSPVDLSDTRFIERQKQKINCSTFTIPACSFQ